MWGKGPLPPAPPPRPPTPAPHTYVPASQDEQFTTSAPDENFPAGQILHEVAPTVELVWSPLPHAKHSLPESEYRPREHVSHERPIGCVPAGQSVHESRSAVENLRGGGVNVGG